MIDLYAASTPNGRKATIMLEETGLPYRLHKLELSAGDQRRPEFLRINPNGKIPVIVDHDASLTIAESGAILIHLAEKSGKLLSSEPAQRIATLQWLFFQVGGLGPMAGQYNHFRRHRPRIDYAFNRYRDEVLRLCAVMDDALGRSDFIAGAYSIADIALSPWMRALKRWDISFADYRNVTRWFESLMRREAVIRGFAALETDREDNMTDETHGAAEKTAPIAAVLKSGPPKRRAQKIAAAGGLFGAIAASSCCVVPLVLVSLGASGAWIGSLTVLEPYKPVFIGVALVFIAAGFWRVYFKKAEQPCEDGTLCARPDSARLTKAALWISAILVLLAATTDYWAPLFY